MATIENNFKVKNGLIVSNTASILSTAANALTVLGGASIGGNLIVQGSVQVNGTVTSIDSTSVDIGTNVVYLSTLSTVSALQAIGSGIVVGTDPNNTTNTLTWISFTFDGSSNWASRGGIYPSQNNFYGLGSNSNAWSSLYVQTVIVKGLTTTTNGIMFVDASGTLRTTTATWNASTGQIQGSITTATTATYAGNLLGGAVASLPYQSNINQTAMLPLGIEGQVLAAGTGTLYWASLTGVTVSTATNFSGGGPGAIPFQLSSGQTAYDDVYFRYSYPGSTASLLVTQNVAVQSGSSATSQVTGALQVTGGVGVTGAIYAGAIYSNGSAVLSSTGTNTAYVSAVLGGTDISVNTTTGVVTVSDTSTLQSVTGRGNSTTNVVKILNTSASFSTQSGALIITGGVGIGGTVYAGTMYSNGNQVLTSGGAGSGYVSSVTAGTDTAVTTSTGAVVIYSTATLQSITGRSNTTTFPIYAGQLYDGNNRVVTNVLPVNGTAISITNVTSTGTATTFTINNLGVTSVVGSTYISVSTSTGSVTITNLGVQTLTAGTDTVVTSSTGTVTVYNTSTLQSVTGRGATTTSKVQFLNTASSTSTATSNSVNIQGGLWVGQDLFVQGRINAFTATVTQIYGSSGQFFGDPTGSGALYAGIPSGFTELPGTVLQLTGNVADYIQTNFQNIGDGPAASADWVATANNGSNYTGFIDMGIANASWNGSQQGSIGWAAGANDGYLYVAGGTGVGNGNLVLGSISTGSQVKISVGVPSTGSWVAVFNPAGTVSTSTTTGAMIIKGGVGIGGTVNVGGNIYVNGNAVLTGSGTGTSYVTSVNAGTDTAVTTSTGNVVVYSTATLQSLTNRSNSTTNAIYANGLYDTNGRVVTSVTPSGSTYIGVSNIVTTGTATSFTINNLGVTNLSGSLNLSATTSTGSITLTNLGVTATIAGTAISVSSNTGSVTITNLGVTATIASTYIGVSSNTGSVTITNLGVQTLTAGTDTVVTSSTGTVTVYNTSTLQSVTNRGSTTSNAINITNTTQSVSSTTGALTVTGGVGVQGNIYGGLIYSNGQQVLTSGGGGGTGYVISIVAGTDTAVSTSSGNIVIWDTSTFQSVTGRGATTTNIVYITNATQSSSSQTGALQVTGGVGVQGNLNVGGSITASTITAQTLIVAYTTITQTLITSPDIFTITNTTTSVSSITGALVVSGGVGIGGNLNVFGTITRNGITVGYGYSGSFGYTGSQGFTGSQGYTGSAGYNGSVGYTGSAGYNGSVGYTGSQGYAGSAGFNGSAGYWGSVGYTGSQGYSGSQGYWGSVGYTGSQGYAGSAGYWGSVGYTGSTGPQGPQGYTGSAGYWGSVGYTGSQGQIGFTGSIGPQGPQGYTGSIGPQGPQGPQGYTGSIGPQGPQGYTGSIGPQGPQGYTGSIGPQGPQGYTGSIGPQGPQGYTGSIGPQGPQGPQGYTGSIGPQGPQGFAGSMGYWGSVGYTGSQGYAGSVGYSGSVGYTGSIGPQGPQGYTGSIGYSGSAGPSNIINATSTASGTLYPVMVRTIGSNQTAFATSNLSYDAATNSLYIAGDLYIDGQQTYITKTNLATGDATLTFSTSSASAATAANSGIQVGSTSTPYASFLYDGSANWVVGGSAATGLKAANITDTGLTAGRVVYPGTGGLLTGSANFFFDAANNNLTINDTGIQYSAKLYVNGSIAARNGGVDGTYADAFVAGYTGNYNEKNIIQTAVSSGGTGSGFRFKVSDGGGLATTTTALDLTRSQILLYTAGTERARIDSNGNVSIGTTSQTQGATLTVNGSSYVSALSTASNFYSTTGATNPGASTAGFGYVANGAYGGGYLLVDGTYNWGIWDVTGVLEIGNGTSGGALTPRLYITPTGGIAFTSTTGYGSAGQYLMSNGNASPSWNTISISTVNLTQVSSGSTPQYMVFANTSTGAATLEANGPTGLVYIPTGNKFGIGTSAPADTDSYGGNNVLDVYGPIYLRQSGSSNRMSMGTSGGISYLDITAGLGFQAQISGGTVLNLDNSGNLQLSASWTTPQQGAKLSVQGGGYFSGIVTATSFSGSIANVQTQLNTSNSTFYPTFVATNSATPASQLLYTTSSFSINPATGVHTIGLATIAGYNVRTSGTASLAALSSATFYPVVFPVDVGRTATRIRIQNDLNSNTPGWGTHPSGFTINLDWSVNGSGWGTIGVSRVIHNYAEAWTNSLICGGITQFTNSSYEVVYLRGGGNYYWETDGSTSVVPFIVSASTVYNSQTIAPSATAVNTPYQQGSGQQGFGTVNANTVLVPGVAQIGPNGTYGLGFLYGGGNTFAGQIYGNSSGLQFTNNGGGNTIIVANNGNVGIGTTGPAAKLDIVGGPTASGYFNAFSSLNSGNNTIAIYQFGQSNTAPLAAVNQIGVSNAEQHLHLVTDTSANLAAGTSTLGIFLRSGGNVGIGTQTPGYRLQVAGSFAATTKSFVIEHPTRPGYDLRYGSLEGPENGVYVRGRLKGNKIELPDYWTKLVDPDTITVNLTPVGKHQKLYVEEIKDNVIIIGNDNLFGKTVDCFYTVFGERCDVESLIVEIEKPQV